MVKDRIVDGVTIRETTPDLSQEEIVERATYIVAGLEEIIRAKKTREINTA